jgi:hypothetical protein
MLMVKKTSSRPSSAARKLVDAALAKKEACTGSLCETSDSASLDVTQADEHVLVCL